MKVALCQLHIEWEDKNINEKKALSFIQKAASEQADLILFPEMSLTGFSMNIDVTKEQNHDSIMRFQCYAADYKVNIGLGWVKAASSDDKAENHYTIIDKMGVVVSDYIKIHPFSYAGENEFFLSGNQVKSFVLEGCCMSTFICYDLRFPEIFQMVSERAQVIILPANWPAKRSEHWNCLLRARAIENQVYILGVNCVGEQGGLYYSGDSCVIDPNGKVLESLHDTEGLLFCDIQDDVEQYRKDFPVKNDRKNYTTEILNLK